MPSKETAEQVLADLLEAEKAITCGQQSQQTYLEMHQARFDAILRLCRTQVPDASARVLDIGRSELTACLASFYQNVHTLGLDPAIDEGGHREMGRMDAVPHITFDLLKSPDVSTWPESEPFDLIVFSEVLEHLSVAPEYVLAALGSLLADKGVLICTTPNATDIGKRIKMAFGRNPFERLRLYTDNPGHIREYTQQELSDIAASVGLQRTNHFYFDWNYDKHGNPIKVAIMKLLRLYPSFRPVQAIVLTRSKSA